MLDQNYHPFFADIFKHLILSGGDDQNGKNVGETHGDLVRPISSLLDDTNDDFDTTFDKGFPRCDELLI